MKDIAHIWEIAGGVASLDLLKVRAKFHARKSHAQTHPPQVPLTPQSVDSAAIAIVIR